MIILFCVVVIRIEEICKYNSVLYDFHVFHCISLIYHIIRHFLEKYVTTKIKDHKILVQMSILSSKLDEVNASYVCKYSSILWDFHVFHCIFINLHIIIHFFEKYVRIKIEDHKILVLMNKLRNWMKLTHVRLVNIIQSCETYMYFINLPYDYALFSKNMYESKLKLYFLWKLIFII